LDLKTGECLRGFVFGHGRPARVLFCPRERAWWYHLDHTLHLATSASQDGVPSSCSEFDHVTEFPRVANKNLVVAVRLERSEKPGRYDYDLHLSLCTPMKGSGYSARGSKWQVKRKNLKVEDVKCRLQDIAHPLMFADHRRLLVLDWEKTQCRPHTRIIVADFGQMPARVRIVERKLKMAALRI